MRFTMARPEVSCHPEVLLDGARTVVSARALLLAPRRIRRRGARAARRATRGATPTPRCASGSTSSPQRLGRPLPRARRLEPARRPRGRRRGGRRLLRQEHDADHPPLRQLGRARHARHRPPSSSRRRRSTPTAAPARSASTPARPTRLDGRRRARRDAAASRTGRSRAECDPERVREPLGDRVYGCDICQDVCPWNRGVERRRADDRPRPAARSRTSRSSTGSRRTTRSCASVRHGCYVPRSDPRYLRRNALVALGNTGSEQDAALAAPFLERRRAPPRARRVGAVGDPA